MLGKKWLEDQRFSPNAAATAQMDSSKPGPDTQEARMTELFCTGKALQRCLASFCKDAQNAQDPVLHVLLIAINSHVQIQLTPVGLQPFQGGELTLPYYRMNPEQRAFLLELTEQTPRWGIHESSMVWRRKGERTSLPPVDVLEAMCSQILASGKTHPDPKSRIAICNIVLQRVQASIPLSHALQAELNARLFPCASPRPDEHEDPSSKKHKGNIGAA